MAWSWSQSGRFDSFEYELIPVKSVTSKPSKKLTGVTGGTLNFKYNSSEKVSGSLDVVKTNLVNNTYIRIWYCPKMPGAGSKRIELATCIAATEKGHYEDGMYSGRIELHGVLRRWIDDKLPRNYTIKKGSSALAYFRKMFKWFGGQYAIKGVKDRKVSKNVLFERGKAPMDVLQWIANYLNAEVTCDAHGRTVLQKYTVPRKKPVSYTVPTGANSLTLPGVDITNSQAGTPNRVSVKYEWTEKYKEQTGTNKNGTPKYTTKTRKKQLVGVANVASSSAVSRKKAGRYITRTYDLKSMKPVTQARIDEIAKTRLKTASGVTTSYTFSLLSYLPFSIGQVVRFRYDKIKIVGIVTEVDMSLDGGCPMTVTVRKVRNG